ncbi:MAG: phage holin family protein [Firmicutes bacterium]|nr:phage holin family protein [Bacillota bacterium]MDH7495001.1 phage holin family protein [Bacillota bacterium]
MLFGAAARFLACTVTLLCLSYVIPGFAAGGFSGAIPAGACAAAAGYVLETLFARRLRNEGRAVVGFLTTAAAAHFTQFFVPGMTVPVGGVLLAGAVVGLTDLLVQVESPPPTDSARPQEDGTKQR